MNIELVLNNLNADSTLFDIVWGSKTIGTLEVGPLKEGHGVDCKEVTILAGGEKYSHSLVSRWISAPSLKQEAVRFLTRIKPLSDWA